MEEELRQTEIIWFGSKQMHTRVHNKMTKLEVDSFFHFEQHRLYRHRYVKLNEQRYTEEHMGGIITQHYFQLKSQGWSCNDFCQISSKVIKNVCPRVKVKIGQEEQTNRHYHYQGWSREQTNKSNSSDSTIRPPCLKCQ